MTIYCIDSSAWLDGWVRDYPRDVFPSLWEKLGEYIATGVLKCSEEVYVELKRKVDGLHEWLMARKAVFVTTDVEIQKRVAALLKEHPRLVDTIRGRSQADPFVIAVAEHLGAVVVTGETPRGNLDVPKIPDVCKARDIRCIDFLAMLRELGWKF